MHFWSGWELKKTNKAATVGGQTSRECSQGLEPPAAEHPAKQPLSHSHQAARAASFIRFQPPADLRLRQQTKQCHAHEVAFPALICGLIVTPRQAQPEKNSPQNSITDLQVRTTFTEPLFCSPWIPAAPLVPRILPQIRAGGFGRGLGDGASHPRNLAATRRDTDGASRSLSVDGAEADALASQRIDAAWRCCLD